jgi:hypothetical protein
LKTTLREAGVSPRTGVRVSQLPPTGVRVSTTKVRGRVEEVSWMLRVTGGSFWRMATVRTEVLERRVGGGCTVSSTGTRRGGAKPSMEAKSMDPEKTPGAVEVGWMLGLRVKGVVKSPEAASMRKPGLEAETR